MSSLAVVLGTRLMADDLGDLLMEILIENSRQTDGLGEHGGRTGAGNAMECLIPPVVGRNAQTGDRRGVKAQLAGLLLHRHLGNEFMRLSAGFFTVHHMKISLLPNSDRFCILIQFLPRGILPHLP